MKVEFLTTLSGIETYHSGDKVEIDDAEALRLIDAGIAIPCVKKQYDEVLAKVLKEEAEKEEKEQQIMKILYENELQEEKEKLLARVLEIDTILGLASKDTQK